MGILVNDIRHPSELRGAQVVCSLYIILEVTSGKRFLKVPLEDKLVG